MTKRHEIKLINCGPNKLRVLKIIKEATFSGLHETKELIDRAPITVYYEESKSRAQSLAKELRKVGATIEWTINKY